MINIFVLQLIYLRVPEGVSVYASNDQLYNEYCTGQLKPGLRVDMGSAQEKLIQEARMGDKGTVIKVEDFTIQVVPPSRDFLSPQPT